MLLASKVKGFNVYRGISAKVPIQPHFMILSVLSSDDRKEKYKRIRGRDGGRKIRNKKVPETLF